MKKIMVVFGTRPEAIKMAPLVHALKKDEHLEPVVVVTAQHREMLDQVLDIFNIKADFDLDVMQREQTLSSITSLVLTRIESVIKEVNPDMILVHGDTTTTFAGALAAFYQEVDIGHVEAGLRTYQKYAPYPEELNRQMVTRLADLHFAPTLFSKNNLLKENVDEKSVFVTGNTVTDSLKTTVKENYKSDILDNHKDKRIILLTAHRRENLGEKMSNIFKAITDIVETHEDVVVIYPMHKNPRVRALANKFLKHDRIECIEPLGAIDFHNFIAHSYLILTDSGGIQEEAPSLGKPVLVLRDVTERPEGVEAGTLQLVGTNRHEIFKTADLLLTDELLYQKMSLLQNPYGDGKASERIVEIIKHHYGFTYDSPKEFQI